MKHLVLLFALAFAGPVKGREPEPSPLDPVAKVPAVSFSSAFEGYLPFAEGELRDWRTANEEVGAAGGHAGHRPGQGPGQRTSKPQPGTPQSSGGPAEKGGMAPKDGGHRGHK